MLKCEGGDTGCFQRRSNQWVEGSEMGASLSSNMNLVSWLQVLSGKVHKFYSPDNDKTQDTNHGSGLLRVIKGNTLEGES